MAHVLTRLLAGPIDTSPIFSAADWQHRLDDATGELECTADRALVAGLTADRVAYAFAGGYQAALARLVAGKLDPARAGRMTSLCITEEGGGHPRAVKTALTPRPDGCFEMTGRKQWATGAPLADRLLVAASRGLDEAGRNRLVVVVIDSKAPGVTLEKMPEPPFAPELPHAVVKLAAVRVEVSDVLPGDGYDTYVKPFRTIEDVHVFLALVGHVIRGARVFGAPREVTELGVATALALREVAAMDASEAETHVALAGALDLGRRLVGESDAIWSNAPDEVRGRWERDRVLVGVAERARVERRSRAWSSLSGDR